MKIGDMIDLTSIDPTFFFPRTSSLKLESRIGKVIATIGIAFLFEGSNGETYLVLKDAPVGVLNRIKYGKY